MKLVHAILKRLGLAIHRQPSDHWIGLDYPVSRTPRYGAKVPPHQQIKELLDRRKDDFRAILEKIAEYSFGDIVTYYEDAAPQQPSWHNGWLGPLDSCALMHFLIENRPKRYLEVGSGNSTIFARHAIKIAGLETRIISIDPEPRREIDELCDQVIRSPLQDSDLSMFDDLEAGDIVFFDASHRIFTDSDTTVFFLDVLPRLKPGVLVHIHDIFWPYDYPAEWGERYYSEQYALAMLILFGSARYETLFPCAFVSSDPQLGPIAASLTPAPKLWGYYGASYWLLSR